MELFSILCSLFSKTHRSLVVQNFKYNLIEIIFVRLATHLRFYVGTLDCQIQI
jgi:hypothetical protein